jgi:Phasin protein
MEDQMSKRKPATKHVRKPKLVVKAQRSAPTVVKSAKHGARFTVTGPTESPFEQIADQSKQNALVGQDESRRAIESATKVFGLSSAAANFRAYQAKLLEMAQADMEFAFEFTQKLAAVRSPVDIPAIVAEFAGRRISMFRKYSKEMIEISTQRMTA